MRLRCADQRWAVETPAKINLFLEVLGKRSDGYHDLETVMVPVNVFDTLVFTEGSTSEVSLHCQFAGSAHRWDRAVAGSYSADFLVPEGCENLAVRAAEALKSATGCQRGIEIKLFKRIPSAAGLAGGSSDAAAVLFALNRIWNLGLSRDELLKIASGIGSDVSFFLSPSPAAICRGRGEIIEPLNGISKLFFVIAKPQSGLSTAQVFRNCTPEPAPRRAGRLVDALRTGNLATCGTSLFNSLQAPALELNSELKAIRRQFNRLGLVGHMMSGSGTSWFGICRHRSEAMTAAAKLRAAGFRQVFVAESPP